ncbi:MAG: nucleoside triphosphate pyrophosphohydrolase [bacterium]|jgi:MazG family protein|nr:nucleoside triphosphate pyrophosphohydrolase [Chitinophagaceae bacterium]
MSNHAIVRLEKIMDELREQCPWDRKQTIHTLRQLTIEECHELADVITDENWKGIKEELGDILLHILFYTKIGTEQNQFTFDDVINGICDKLIFRHPHIYGDVVVKDEEEVKRNWENLKLKEGKTSVMSGVPRSLPPMVQAMRIQEKAKQVGFEWENKEQVWEKVKEEMEEVRAEVEQHDAADQSNQIGHQKNKIEEEIGDLLFSVINYARFLDIDPDNALARTNKKFLTRFQSMEKIIIDKGQRMTDLSLDQMDEIWNEVKNH